jgi:GTPase SAR1 family protein
MIKNIELKNFKNFLEFKLNKLKPINLIVGKNNVGKTNLIEALFIGSNPTNLSLFITTITNRSRLFFPQLLEYFFSNAEKPIIMKLDKFYAQYSLLREDGEIVGIQSVFRDKKYMLRFQKVISEYPHIKSFSTPIIEEKLISQQNPSPAKTSILSMLISPNQPVNVTNILVFFTYDVI